MSNCPVEGQQHTGCAAWYCLDQRGSRSLQAIDEAVLTRTMLRHASALAVLVQTGHMHGEPTPQAATEIPAIIINLLRSMRATPTVRALMALPRVVLPYLWTCSAILKKKKKRSLDARYVCVQGVGGGGGACLSRWEVHLVVQNIGFQYGALESVGAGCQCSQCI